MPKDSTAYGPSSNPSSRSYSGGGGGGGVSSGKTTGNVNSGDIRGASPLAGFANARPTTGITTGNTIYGNTAYGPSGGMAQGYATRTGGISGMGPSVGTYSNFRNLDGSAAIPGAGNMTAMGRNPQQARSVLERQFNPAGRPRVGGLLDGEQVSVVPIPTRRIVPTAMPIPRPPQQITGFWPGQAINPFARGMFLMKDQARVGSSYNDPWPGQAVNQYARGLMTKFQDRISPTLKDGPGYRWTDPKTNAPLNPRASGYGTGGGGGSGW